MGEHAWACPSTADDQGKGEYPLLPNLNVYRTGGLAARPGSCRRIAGRGQGLRRWERDMRVLLSTYGGRGDVEPLVGLAVRLRALGAQVRVCAPPDEEFERRLAGVGVP